MLLAQRIGGVEACSRVGLVVGMMLATVMMSAPARAHIGDLVFCDRNENGIFEPPQDTGIAGVTVVMTCPDDTSYNATTVTNAQGRYLFPSEPLSACTVTVDRSTLPNPNATLTTPLVGVRPPPTAEHSPFPGYTAQDAGVVCDAQNGSSMSTSIIADGVFSTTVNNLDACQDPACVTATGPGPDPCFTDGVNSPPFYGYYGDDFGFVCASQGTIPAVSSPLGPAGLVLIAGLAGAMAVSLRRWSGHRRARLSSVR